MYRITKDLDGFKKDNYNFSNSNRKIDYKYY